MPSKYKITKERLNEYDSLFDQYQTPAENLPKETESVKIKELYLMINQIDQRKTTKDDLPKLIQKVCKKADAEELSKHQFRTFCMYTAAMQRLGTCDIDLPSFSKTNQNDLELLWKSNVTEEVKEVDQQIDE